MPGALGVAHYLGLAVQRFAQFADVISIPNSGPRGTAQLILPLAKMHWRQSALNTDPKEICRSFLADN
jgi:hypothetical protein